METKPPSPPSDPAPEKAAPAPKPRRIVRGSLAIFLLTLAYSFAAVSLIALATNVEVYRRWTVFYKISPMMFLANVLIFQAVLTILHAVLDRWMLAATVWTVAVGALAVPNIVKMAMLSRPLLPWDFFLIGQMISLVPVMKDENNALFAAIAALPFALFFAFYFSFKPRNIVASKRYRRIAGALHLAALLAVVFSFSGLRESDAATGSAVISRWNQKENYDRNGFLFSFLYNATRGANEGFRPKGYSEKAVAEAVERIERSVAPDRSAAAAQSPSGDPVNVIMILLEAFSDPTRLPVEFSEDPIPFVHRLQASSRSGDLIVPTFGGYTSRTEFEALTGFSLRYLYEVSNPYTAYVHRPLPALPALFKENGYRTLAIHPFAGDFWERDRVYPLLGFDRFIDDKSFENPRMAGPYISDEELTDKIIANSEGEGPYFIFGVTMSTHAPFKYAEPVDEPIQVTTPMSPASRATLRTYANAVNRADRALERLVEHFEKDGRKTMILAFGDHMPMLGENKEVYLETGMLKDPDDMPEKMYRTPVVAWANFDLPCQSLNRRSSFLYSFVAQSAGLAPTAFSALNAVEAKNNPQLDDVGLNRDYEMIEYDSIFGDRFAANLPFHAALPERAEEKPLVSLGKGASVAFPPKADKE